MGSELPADWDEARLGDCGRWLSGGTPSTQNPDFWGGDIPWISGKSLTTHYLRDSDRRVTTLGAANGTRIAPQGSTLMVVRGMSLRTEFRSGIAMRELAFGQDCKAIIPREGIEPRFLANAVRARAPEILGMVESSSHGTGRLATELIQALRIGLPPMAEQRAIVEVLGSLDDRIEWSKRVLQALEALLSTTFGLLDRQQEATTLRSVMELTSGRSYKSIDLVDQSTVGLINLKNIPRGGGYRSEGVKGYSGAYKPSQVANPGDLVLACTDLTQAGDVIGRVGRVRSHRDFETLVPSMDLALVRPSVDWVSSHVLAAVMSESEYISHVKRYINGTTVLHLDKRGVLDYEVRLPTASALRDFAQFAGDVWERQDLLVSEADSLIGLRDALLPKLVSGELRIDNPERLLDQVA